MKVLSGLSFLTGRIKSGKIKSGNYFRAMTQLPRPLRFAVILLFALLSGCSHLVKISYAPEAVIHPAFDQPTINWDGERVQVVLAPSVAPRRFLPLSLVGESAAVQRRA